jgi:ubiquinone/menaquinone biosynthesis C-methylase UbiE
MNTETGKQSIIIRAGMKLLPGVIYVLSRPIRRELGNGIKTLLDVGCGKGFVSRFITQPGKRFTVGAEIFGPDLREARRNRSHSAFVQCDARSLPFKRDSFDAVLCSEVLEHVDKLEGVKLIQDLEDIARRKVLLSTPAGLLPTDPETNRTQEEETNPYQKHRAGWGAEELKALGYRVYSPLFLHKIEKYLTSRQQTWAWLLNIIIQSAAAPLVWISPRFGGHLFCVKELDNKSRLNPAA